MSDPGSTPAKDTFGVPEGHFLRLAVDLLSGLELQSRERGHSTLASLIDIAKSEAEEALRAAPGSNQEVPAEAKLLRLAKAIRKRAAN
jgi:hypothetical protein